MSNGIFARFILFLNIATERKSLINGTIGAATVGKNTAKIKGYIANQLKEDKEVEQMTITELVDPFKK